MLACTCLVYTRMLTQKTKDNEHHGKSMGTSEYNKGLSRALDLFKSPTGRAFVNDWSQNGYGFFLCVLLAVQDRTKKPSDRKHESTAF